MSRRAADVELRAAFSGLLATARKRKGLTQQQLAEAIGIPRTSVSNIENGAQGVPLHILYRMADVLGVEPKDMLPTKKPEPKRVRRELRISGGQKLPDDVMEWIEGLSFDHD